MRKDFMNYMDNENNTVTIYVWDYGRGMDWWMNLLTTDINHSELQLITALLIISTLHKSPKHQITLFQRAVFNQPFHGNGF
jgi:hypothetical protein